jgi:hypothetical protein
MMAQVGLDVVLDIEQHYCAEHPGYPEGPRRLLRSYLEQGRLGGEVRRGLLRRLPTPMTTPLWLQVIQAAGGIATIVGVLIALYIALIRDPREASAERKYLVAQIEAFRRARTERFGHAVTF